MKERRKNRRSPLKLALAINELFKQDNEIIDELQGEFHIVDISRTGIGFECAHVLPLEYYFDARIDFDKKEFFYCVVKLVRKNPQPNTYIYGCEFVGMPEFISDKIEDYQCRLEDETAL